MADTTNKRTPIRLAFPVVHGGFAPTSIEQLSPTNLSPVEQNSVPSDKALSPENFPSPRSGALSNYDELFDEIDSDTFRALTMNRTNSEPRSEVTDSAVLSGWSGVHSQIRELENVVKELERELEQLRVDTEANRDRQEMLAAVTRAHQCTLAPLMELEFLRNIQQLQTDAATKRDREIDTCDDCMMAYIEHPASARLCIGGDLTTWTATVSEEEDLEIVGADLKLS